MIELVLRAKLILADMFKIDICHFDKHTSRKVKVIEARRFLVYFLRDELGITYGKTLKYCPALTNHATVIHHCKRFKELLELYPSIRNDYEFFRAKIVTDPDNLIERQIIEMVDKRKHINNQLYKLKKLLT